MHVLPQLQQSRQSQAQKFTEAKEGQENQVVDALETRLRAQITALETALESTALGTPSFPASTGTCFVLLLLLSERLVNKNISSVCVSQVRGYSRRYVACKDDVGKCKEDVGRCKDDVGACKEDVMLVGAKSMLLSAKGVFAQRLDIKCAPCSMAGRTRAHGKRIIVEAARRWWASVQVAIASSVCFLARRRLDATRCLHLAHSIALLAPLLSKLSHR